MLQVCRKYNIAFTNVVSSNRDLQERHGQHRSISWNAKFLVRPTRPPASSGSEKRNLRLFQHSGAL